MNHTIPAHDSTVPSVAPTSLVTGLVLAAGAGRRLRPHTDSLPKTLVRLDDGTTVLDRTLSNFRQNGIESVAIVVGYCAGAITDQLDDLQRRHRVQIDVIVNDHPEDRNNAYSLWCAREVLSGGALLCNGDTIHPADVQRILLVDHAEAPHIRLAVDAVKVLGDEEMKVDLDDDGRLRAISKTLPHDSSGEYIGVAFVPAAAGPALVEALEATWRRDPQHFYEAAFQSLADAATPVETRAIGRTTWIEIDSLDDLSTANRLLCRS